MSLQGSDDERELTDAQRWLASAQRDHDRLADHAFTLKVKACLEGKWFRVADVKNTATFPMFRALVLLIYIT